MAVGSGLYMYDVVVKRSRSLSHILVSSCLPTDLVQYFRRKANAINYSIACRPWLELRFSFIVKNHI